MMHTLTILIEVFFGRHWLVAITNAVLTVLLGLSLLRWAQGWHILHLTPIHFLRLRRLVLIAALCKGTLYLLLGVSFRQASDSCLMFGVQLPGPLEVPGLDAPRPGSIWYPTSATFWVTIMMLGAASCSLLGRAVQMYRARRTLGALIRLAPCTTDQRIATLLGRAAAHHGMIWGRSMPAVILAEVPYPTPMLLGIQHPYLLLSPGLVRFLSDEELEMALRHELAHLRCGDQLWRWPLTWLEDVGRLNVLSGHIGNSILDLEEEICDRLSVNTPRTAFYLAEAIRKTAAYHQTTAFDEQPEDSTKWMGRKGVLVRSGPALQEEANDAGMNGPVTRNLRGTAEAQPGQEQVALPVQLLPALLGRHTRKWNRPALLHKRIQSLLLLAHEFASAPSTASLSFSAHGQLVCPLPERRLAEVASRLALGVLMLLILYIKFYAALAVPITR